MVATTCEDHHIFLRELFDEVMEEETVPEIQRTNLTKVVLHLKTMGVNDVLRWNILIVLNEKQIKGNKRNEKSRNGRGK